MAVTLAAAGAGLILLSAGRPWAQAVVTEGPLRLPVRPSGRALAPPVPALGIAALAGAVAVLATRGLGRLLTGALLVAAGAAVAVLAVTAAADLAAAVRAEAGRAVGQQAADPDQVQATAWPWLAGLGGLLTAAGGGLTLARGRRWPGMSGRYETAPASPATEVPPPGPAEPGRRLGGMWEALDRGDDPTA